MPTEVEARFRADDQRPLRELAVLDRLAGAHLGPARTIDEIDTYLDTSDGALAAARWACRLRTRGDRVVVSMKGPPDEAPAGAIHRRPEVEGPATASHDPAAWPSSPARDLVDRLRVGGALVERLTLRQQRTERAVEVGGEPIGLLSLDEVRVLAGGEERGRFTVVEIELAPDHAHDETQLGHLAAALAARPGLAPDPQTKLERSLELVRIE